MVGLNLDIVFIGVSPRRVLAELHDFLFKGHTGQKVVNPPVDRDGCILIERRRLCFHLCGYNARTYGRRDKHAGTSQHTQDSFHFCFGIRFGSPGGLPG